MTGTKTNEHPGTRARVSYVRSSAFKAREVLDLIRGKGYAEASDILDFSERSIARDVKKVLDSAVANAEHNDEQVAEELFVSACYADEGPTLKRWRPRARGRATRIRKRTCHITVIVSRLDDETLDRLRAREASTGRSGSAQAADARRRRVAQSREQAAEHDHDHDHDDDEPSVEDQADEVLKATEAALAEDEATEDEATEAERTEDETSPEDSERSNGAAGDEDDAEENS